MAQADLALTWAVRSAVPADAGEWERMRQLLWPAAPGEHAGEIARYFAGEYPLLDEVLVACDGEGRPIGFAELSVRSHVDSCESLGVGYLEGWFVDEAFRRQGAGAALIAAAERWARGRGCTEFGSDVEIQNDVSAAAHRALGFEETSRVITFRKSL